MQVAAVAHDLAGREGKEIGSAMPLLPVGIHPVIIPAEDGFVIVTDLMQGFQHVVAYRFMHHAVFHFEQAGRIRIPAQQQGLVHHAMAAAQEGEHHVHVDKGFRIMGQFLRNHIEKRRFLTSDADEGIHPVAVGTRALAYHEHVGRGYQEIAAFQTGACRRILPWIDPSLAGGEERMVFINGVGYQDFHRTDLGGHMGRHGMMIEADPDVAGEVEVVHRIHGRSRQAVHQGFAQGLGIQAFQMPQSLFGDAFSPELAHDIVFRFRYFFQDFPEKVVNIERRADARQNSFQLAVFLLCRPSRQQIAIQCFLDGSWSHVFQFRPRPVQHHCP